MITIKTIDEHEIQVSNMISAMVETINPDNMMNEINIKSYSLQCIIIHCENNNYVRPPPVFKPLQYNDFAKCIHQPKDAELILSKDILLCIELLKDCLLVKCPSLCDLLYARIANYFKTTPLCEIKDTFGLSSTSISKEEIEELIKKYQLMEPNA